MARAFDGANDNIALGTDASVDNFTVRTCCAWVRRAVTNARYAVISKTNGANTGHVGLRLGQDSDSNGCQVLQQFDTTNGVWRGGTALNSTTAFYHIATVYDKSATTNDPLIYVNGASETITEQLTPVGTASDDSARTLQLGEEQSGAGDFSGEMMCVVYHNAALTAEQINRAKWWGRPGGGLVVYHPLFTDKLANEGSATADGTATGTTVAAMACPVVRPGTSMMGMGVGW